MDNDGIGMLHREELVAVLKEVVNLEVESILQLFMQFGPRQYEAIDDMETALLRRSSREVWNACRFAMAWLAASVQQHCLLGTLCTFLMCCVLQSFLALASSNAHRAKCMFL